MTGSYALDTDVCVEVIRGNTSVVKRLSAVETAFIPYPVVAELAYGALCSRDPAMGFRLLHDLAERCNLIPCDKPVAMLFARVKYALRVKRKPIPTNDIWTAACALSRSLPLATSDAHFSEIDGLDVESWQWGGYVVGCIANSRGLA